MPLSLALAPGGSYAVVLLGGWREQGIQVVETKTGRVVQSLLQPAAFVGLAFAPDGKTLFVSGGNQDVVYRYSWNGHSVTLSDSLVLASKIPGESGTRYPAGLAVSVDGQMLFVAENLADSLAVVDIASGRVVQRLATERYPYGVAVSADGVVYVSAWGGNTVSIFTTAAQGGLIDAGRLRVVRHPSALLLNKDGSRLFVVSGSTDRIAVVDTKSRAVIHTLVDSVPGGPGEGSTPNALAITGDGKRLFVAEADNNAVALFDLSARTSGIAAAGDSDRLAGRVPVGWYPTAVLVAGDRLLVANGKGDGTAPNPGGPTPAMARTPGMREYTLGQLSGTLSSVPLTSLSPAGLLAQSVRVASLNGWRGGVEHAVSSTALQSVYPPFEHVIYIIKENRSYDQLFGDLRIGDGDSTLLFFPRHVAPNHHALAERFGVFDRFFVNAEVSPDGHNWSTAAYVSDYGEKTIPSNYSSRGRTYDYEGLNRGWAMKDIPTDDVNEPANGYLWNLAERAGISFRNYGEFVARKLTSDPSRSEKGRVDTTYIGNKPFLRTHTNEQYPGFDLDILDQRRMDVWLAEFARYVANGRLPALEIVRLPNDHTMGAVGGKRTPWAYMADNDLALGRMIEAISASQYWHNTVIFVVEDDAQNGPDHVDSHRAPVLVISAYNRPGVYHRWTNTTDVVETIGEILHLGQLSQFDAFGRPLRDVFAATPDTAHYQARIPDVRLDARNPEHTSDARASERLDFSQEDRANEDQFNRILWRTIKGARVPYPGPTRMSALEWRRSR